MNWTAILALLAINAAAFGLVWYFGRAVIVALATVKDFQRQAATANEHRHAADLEAQRLAGELATEQRLHRNLLARQSRRQSRTGQRAGETDNG